MSAQTVSKLMQLPARQRLEIAERLWLSVADEEKMAVPEDHKRTLRKDIEGIREALHKEPFLAFTIRMAAGRRLPVPHPDFVAVVPRRIVVVAEDGSWSVVEPRLIASLDYDGTHSSAPPKS